MDALESIAAAVLYEGYVLWPYRRSARKNQQRWTFGGVYPPAFADANDRAWVRTECLLRGGAPDVKVELRFLQVVERQPAHMTGNGELESVDQLGGVLAWEEAAERRVPPGEIHIAAGEEREPVDGGLIVRRWQALDGQFVVCTEPLADGIWRVSAGLHNTSRWSGTDRLEAQRHGFMSAHIVLTVDNGEFVSLTDPPSELTYAAAACQNVGLWPVLVANPQTLLASPIILSDYPRVAPESPGLLFDSGEIDQLLYLNTLTLTDAEKAEARATDPRVGEILDRAESLSAEDLGRLHGAIRELRVLSELAAPDHLLVGGVEVKRGSTVRLHPRRRADAFDIALADKLATVDSIEQDFEERVQLAVTVDEDPGRDLGELRLPGHRFFFSPDEVEPVP